MKWRGQRVAGKAGSGNMTAGLFAERIVQGGDYGSLFGRQQLRQMVENGLEQSMWIPRAAREQPIVGTPIQKLAAGCANGIAGQMRTQTQEQTVT